MSKEYKLVIKPRKSLESEAVIVKGEDSFTINGKEYKFEEVSLITISDSDNSGYSGESIKNLFKK